LRGLVSLEVAYGAWDAFVPYGGLHLAAVFVCALLVAGLVMRARALAAPQEAALRRGVRHFRDRLDRLQYLVEPPRAQPRHRPAAAHL
jgi:hypothetical protein